MAEPELNAIKPGQAFLICELSGRFAAAASTIRPTPGETPPSIEAYSVPLLMIMTQNVALDYEIAQQNRDAA